MNDQWTNGEIGPDCFCGSPTVVVIVDGEPLLMCFSHTTAEGEMFDLPKEKHPKWPNLTSEEMQAYMNTAPRLEGK